jgi:hypothetical protein
MLYLNPQSAVWVSSLRNYWCNIFRLGLNSTDFLPCLGSKPAGFFLELVSLHSMMSEFLVLIQLKTTSGSPPIALVSVSVVICT